MCIRDRLHLDVVVLKLFLVQDRSAVSTGILPGGDVGELAVVTQGLAVLGLTLDPEVTPARLFAVQGVDDDQLAQLEEVSHPASTLQRLVQILVLAGDLDVAPELRLCLLYTSD